VEKTGLHLTPILGIGLSRDVVSVICRHFHCGCRVRRLISYLASMPARKNFQIQLGLRRAIGIDRYSLLV
jgi:hypothetical protein